MDIAKLNDGRIAMLIKDNSDVLFSSGKWSLLATPIGARPRKQTLFWVRTTSIAKRYTIGDTK